MSTAGLPKVAGINPPIPASAHTAAPAVEQRAHPDGRSAPGGPDGTDEPAGQPGTAQDALASWVDDLTTLHELSERLARTACVEDALREMLRAGGTLTGARRGLAAAGPADHGRPATVTGLGLCPAELGALETVPLPASPGTVPAEEIHPDLCHEPGLDPRHREVAVRLGLGASYTVRLATENAGRLGSAVWFYDEPAEPGERLRHLIGLYCRHATEHLARLVELDHLRATAAALRAQLLPTRLPRIPGVRLAVTHVAAPGGGGDWYDAMALPEGALGLSVGGVTGSGTGTVGAMGRLRAALRAYAVMEGEDPVAVLSDLELLLRLTEPARSATALYAHVDLTSRRIALSGAGHCPPLVVGERRVEFVETSLSAPLGMLSCWEAPGAEFRALPGETLLLYTDGLLHRTGDATDRAVTRLHAAAAGAPRAVREDPALLADHVLRTLLPDGRGAHEDTEDLVLLAARFD
ncbi:PP2C family protein-serine/threonine phosphatase [Streptomyces sp. NPDC002574]|uniref:PP2C family protein-serine/threonine phosphatase n=1 Tax=Streptomyces sp. NPDC002574 TaxID=3364652 RepID=UPI0036ACD8D9